MIIGINTTKDAIFVAETRIQNDQFEVSKIHRLQFELIKAGDLSHLLQSITTVLSQKAGSPARTIAILKCSGGQHGSSVEAIKAEAIVQLAADQNNLSVVLVAPQSLKKILECGSGQKWQKKSKLMFNPAGEFKYWTQGANGAVCAAYKVIKG